MKPHYVAVMAAMLAATGIVIGFIYVGEFFAVDGCLDRGGRWDYSGGHCEPS